MDHGARKFSQMRLKPASSATATSWNVEILYGAKIEYDKEMQKLRPLFLLRVLA